MKYKDEMTWECRERERNIRTDHREGVVWLNSLRMPLARRVCGNGDENLVQKATLNFLDGYVLVSYLGNAVCQGVRLLISQLS
jgi:hypothetical protein